MPDAPATNRLGHLTERQREAIRTVGCSLLVSAAAGAGKTTVLAERCAYLVCDLPDDQRCDIDELLVVTFTDAAAGEMRTRIRKAIQQRRRESPQKDRLDRQLHLLESASISTIHSFCKSLIQQWFPEAGVDPQAAVLAEDEADLLRREVLDALFVELYASDDDHGRAFQSLVDDYGAGDDHMIAEAVLSIHGFAHSLPDPADWLDGALRRLDPTANGNLIAQIDDVQWQRLTRELEYQIEQSRDNARIIDRTYPAASMRSDALRTHQARCEAWLAALKEGGPRIWQAVAGEVNGYTMEIGRKPNRNRLTEKENADYDAAAKLIEDQRKCFRSRVQEAVCRFTADEYRAGLEQIRPYVGTIVRIVRDFDNRYQQAKAAQAAVDFNDLQRQAYRLLAEDGGPDRPSKIARQLQRRYRHVLVDEFQDVDPLQEAILRLVSRETADPPEGNLFAVGDIKQSIYRFRLAEPGLFSRRADEFDRGSPLGRLIHLQHNFRSRKGIIDAVNLVFAPLMSESFGGSVYNEKTRLHAGADYPPPNGARTFDGPAVELHLLERITAATEAHEETTEAEEREAEAPETGPAAEDLEGIEREGYLIARRIRDWMGIEPAGPRMHVVDKHSSNGELFLRPINYHDIVILLRSMPFKAEPIANILRRMGIPVLVGRGESGADSTEFRDIISLLRVLDNRRQDIPLAAVLRSPLIGGPLSETELFRIRLIDRDVPFHQAVVQYATQGPDADLRDRLAVILATLDRWRTQIRRAPVAEVLWEILEEAHYPAFVSGLPDGHRRRERLIRFHDLAREFGQFRRQGLRRFLRFMDEMLEADRAPQQQVGAGDDDAVRIMTVHTSKGLEFPVVILADLAKPFNLSDATRSILIHRRQGVALLAADPEQRTYYPTLIHQLAADDHRNQSLSEELRILYVALTRAREHLMLVGRTDLDEVAACRVPRDSSAASLPHLRLETARAPLAWVLAALGAASPGAVRWAEGNAADAAALVEVREYPRSETDQWNMPPAVVSERAEALARMARLEPLPDDEPRGPADEAERIIASMDSLYACQELTTLPARVSVTELKRRWEAWSDPDERPVPVRVRPEVNAAPVFTEALPEGQAANRGIATHRFCQLIDLTRPCDAADLAAQQRELLEAGRLAPQEAAAMLLDSVAWFLSTPLGQHVRRNAARVRREVAFVSRIAAERYDPMVVGRDSRDVLLLRGTVDLLICHDDHLELFDYKTDAVPAEACPGRAASYRTQVDYYAEAMHGIFQRPVSRRWLVFLQPRCIIDLSREPD